MNSEYDNTPLMLSVYGTQTASITYVIKSCVRARSHACATVWIRYVALKMIYSVKSRFCINGLVPVLYTLIEKEELLLRCVNKQNVNSTRSTPNALNALSKF